MFEPGFERSAYTYMQTFLIIKDDIPFDKSCNHAQH